MAILDRVMPINVGLARLLVITFFHNIRRPGLGCMQKNTAKKKKNAATPCHVSLWYQLQSDVTFVDPYELDSLC